MDEVVAGRRLVVDRTVVGPTVIGLTLAVFAFVPDLLAPHLVTWITVTASVLGLLLSFQTLTSPARWNFPTSCVVIYSLIVTVSLVHYGQVGDFVESLAAAVLTTLIVLLTSNFSRRQVNQLINCVLLIAGMEFLFALAEEQFHVKAPRGYEGLAGSTFARNPLLHYAAGRVPGTLGNAVPLGALMAVALVLVFFAKRQWTFARRTILELIFLYGILLSGTRSALLFALAAGAIAVFLTSAIPHVLAWRAILVAAAVITPFFLVNEAIRVYTNLAKTGSLTHRVAALDAASKLFGREVSQVIFGSGYGSVSTLFNLNFLQLDGFHAVDNQFVSLFALGGVVGTLVVIGLLIFGCLRGHRSSRPAALFLVFMFFSFDLMQQTFTLVLFAALISAGSVGSRRRGEQEAPPPGKAEGLQVEDAPDSRSQVVQLV